MTDIIPVKLIITYKKDGTIKSQVLQYRIRENGKVKGEFRTMDVKDGIGELETQSILTAAIIHARIGEKIDVAD
jgi:hypothetical protein